MPILIFKIWIFNKLYLTLNFDDQLLGLFFSDISNLSI